MKLIGKDKPRKYFDTLIENRALRQFYIIEGAKGVGRKTLVDYIAMKIHCESDASPCMKCPSCIKHMTGNHPDYIKIKNDDKEKKNITVDTIRQVSSDIFVKPFISDTKIYVLDDNLPIGTEGQNAFLKILEEPPSYAIIFVIVKDKSTLLETVISRGMVCHVSPCTKEETKTYIEENYPESRDMASFISDYSGGVLGEAEKMATEGDFFKMRSDFYSALKEITNSKAQGICQVSRFFAKYKDSSDIWLNLFASWLRDVFLVKNMKNVNIINYDYKNDINAFASCVTNDEIIKTSDSVFDMAKKFSKGHNAELWICDVLSQLY